MTELEAAVRIGIAALVGLAVGLEREWSGHADGVRGRFAGIRTFFLIGTAAGIAGVLVAESHATVGAVIAGATVAITIVAYAMATRRRTADLDGTTEVAAIVVVALGLIAGTGWLKLAAGAGSVVVLALREKTRLHAFVKRVEEEELRSALQFGALALVVLPLLPEGPFGGSLEIRPRALWTVVLIFSGVNFVGHLVRRAVGPDLGYGIAGALGGLVSSTAVTLTFSRLSRREPALAPALSRGIIAASAVLPLRVIAVSTVVNHDVGVALMPYLLPQAAVGGALAFLIARHEKDARKVDDETSKNPLALGTAIQMALAFQIAMILIVGARNAWGSGGVYASGAFLGLTDMDALTFSMSRPQSGLDAAVAARVITVGVISNSALKTGLALFVGNATVRRYAGAAIGALTLTGVAALVLISAN